MNFYPEFKDKVALVTGAGGGIGRASALGFAYCQARVVVADIDPLKGKETVALIQKEGGEAIFIQANVAVAKDVEALIDQTFKTYGRLDYGHNNAGIEGKKALLTEQTEEDWDKMAAINLKGAWLCMKYEIPALLQSGGGAIVNTGSIASELGLRNYGPYCAAKHGLIGLTKTAALEFAKRNIRVNAVCPGLIETDMITRSIVGETVEAAPLSFLQGLKKKIGYAILKNKQPSGRMGLPEEVAMAVLWLCSDQSSFVNGHALVVDGGYVIK
ncbi:MAG: glucose 1-dehydrogenase [Candidatus Omnitrophica bacterium]|nr:glucose 1-dehydrogenase [Candidatus Omnitrophota bacterium]MDE2223201.1 glucose 1-dehydrogenase [Candidatus Omnitrophota bacterium]